jgi:hypothetical protein
MRYMKGRLSSWVLVDYTTQWKSTAPSADKQ